MAAVYFHSIASGIICLIAIGLSSPFSGAIAKEAPTKKAQHVNSREPAIIVARIWKDGSPCRGMARLRPLNGGQMDMSRFVNIGYVTDLDVKPQLQAMGEFFAKGLTLDIKGLTADMNKELKDQFVPIAPGAYVMTNITCMSGNQKSWIGGDRSVCSLPSPDHPHRSREPM